MKTVSASAALLALAVAALGACAPAGEVDGAPDFDRAERAHLVALPHADLRVWPADAELRAWVLTVAPRIERATGLVVAVVDGEQTTSDCVPMFWSTRGADEGWQGIMHDGDSDFVALEASTPMHVREAVVLHEVLHALGAGHVATGEGVLSPEIWERPEGWPLTTADLTSVCAAQDCSRFVPESAL